ncbi:MAG: hypothetical protein ABSB89_02770 [Candidatus Bathyarchaeia archaeon]|jgi:Na+/phosphate symporter
MEMTEKERLMLNEKRDHICELTKKILDLAQKPENSLEIKKNMTNILSDLNAIASYADSNKSSLNQFTIAVTQLFLEMDEERSRESWIASPIDIEVVCNWANSVRFNFTKKSFKLILPKNLNLGIHFHNR